MDKEFPYTIDFQKAILRTIISNGRFGFKAISFLKEEFFADKHLGWFFREIQNFHNKYGNFPDVPALKNLIKKHKLEDQPVYEQTLQEVINLNGDFAIEYLEKELTGFVRRHEFAQVFYKSQELYNSRQEDKAYDAMDDAMVKIKQVNFGEDIAISWDDLTYYLNRLSSSNSFVPTGIAPIDTALGGGIRLGTGGVLLSGTNTGKTMSLTSICRHATKAKNRVMWVFHEDTRELVIGRLISSYSGIPYNRVKLPLSYLTKNEVEVIKLVQAHLKKYLLLIPMFEIGTTIEDVYRVACMKKKEFDFTLFIDDYGQRIKTKTTHRETRDIHAEVYGGFKRIAANLGVAAISPVQGNRDSNKNNKIGTFMETFDISDCFRIIMDADFVIALNRSRENVVNNELIYGLMKQKEGRGDVFVRCNTDFSRCITHDATLGMNEINSEDALKFLTSGRKK